MALSTKTLDALNDSRKTEPHKYIWGQFTPDKEGVGYSDLPEQTNIPDYAKLVLDVNGPSLVTASVKDLKSGIGSLLHDDLATKVNKAGDTMTGTLKMSGNNEIKFGTDDNYYYYIKKISNGTFEIYNKNGKGLFLQAAEAHAPCYWDGTKAYRLLTTADLENIDYVVDRKVPTADDPTWYRKYKSGWLEQGGVAPATTENITFLKPFANTNYTVIGNISLTYRRAGQGDGSGSLLFFPEATSFCYVTWAARNFGDIGNQNISWRAEGQGA